MADAATPEVKPKNTWIDFASYATDKVFALVQTALLIYIYSKQPSLAPSVVTTETGGVAVVSQPNVKPVAPVPPVVSDPVLEKLNALTAKLDAVTAKADATETKLAAALAKKQ